MKNAALLVLTASFLFTVSGHAGGWLTSGQQRAAPVEATPVAGPFKVSCTITVNSSKAPESMTITEEFTDAQFKYGHLLFTTTGLPGKSYLAGHQLSLSLFRYFQGPDLMRLSIDGVLQNKYYSVHSNADSTALRSDGVVRTSVSIRATRPGVTDTLSLSASCREIK